MKKTMLFLSSVFIVASCQTEPTQQDVVAYGSSITEAELKEHLYTYASDEFEGRDTGKEGEKKATEYLKNEYEALGISPVQEGNYYQTIPLNLMKSPKVSITVNGNDFNYYEHYISQTSAPSATIDASEVVYVGYGVDDEKHSDYANIDVKGKVVVVKAGEPKSADGNYVISGTDKVSKWSSGRQALSAKGGAAKEKGAKAVFVVDNASFERYAKWMKDRDAHGGGGRLSLPSKDDATEEIYAFLINDEMGRALVNNINDSEEVATVAAEFKMSYETSSEEFPANNVAAIIKGSEKPEEYIVISAHLDHVGKRENGDIYNGADDDGSGTVSMLEIAEAFKEAADKGHGPKRSIIFLHVTGEEKGLLGSKYYTDYAPLVPLANTVANLNIDMIGRIDPKREGDRNYIYLIGADKLSTELHNISEEMNKTYTNIELDYTYNDENDPNRFYYRSDHYNFAKNNIPIIFYFNGTHEDYHRATDTPDKIEYDLLENRSRLVFHTAWELANREERIVVDKATATP